MAKRESVVIVIEDGTVRDVFSGIDVRVVVLEPDLIGDLSERVWEPLVFETGDLRLPADLQRRVARLVG